MYKPISLFFALRFIWNSHIENFKKIISLLSILGISISTASLIIVISIINGSEEHFKKSVLSFIPHLVITNKNQYIHKSKFPQNILTLNNFEKISDFFKKEVIIESNNEISMAEIIGFDNSNNYKINNYNIKNISNILKIGKNNIIIGKKLAEKLNVHIGDTIKLIVLSNTKKIFSETNFNQNIFKIISIFSTQSEADYYQILMNKQDYMKFLHYSKNYITGWRIWLKDPFSFKNINLIKKYTKNLILLDWKVEKGEIFKTIKIEKYIMLFLFFLILLVAMFNVFIILTVHIIEKEKSIAILKTQGLKNWKIILIFIIFGSGISLIGNILGTIISVALIQQNNLLKFFINFFFNEININIVMVPFQIFFINIIFILLTIFSTLYPSWNSIRLKPARVLSNE